MEALDFCFSHKQKRLRKLKVMQILLFEKSIKTYNLTRIANSNNYFANDILVNNESDIK